MRFNIPLPGEKFVLMEDATLIATPVLASNWFRAIKAKRDPRFSHRYLPAPELFDAPLTLPKGSELTINAMWFQPSWTKLISVTVVAPGVKGKPRLYFNRDELAQLEVQRI